MIGTPDGVRNNSLAFSVSHALIIVNSDSSVEHALAGDQKVGYEFESGSVKPIGYVD